MMAKAMKSIRLIHIFFLATLGYAFPVSAETDADSIRVDYVLNPIIKTATKMDGAQRDLAASVSLLTERDLKLASTDAVLGAVQHRIPSLHLTEWGVMGFGAAGRSAGKISLRGAGGGANTHVLVLRNGRPDFMGLMGCTIADEFTTDGVGRIEVIRGPASFLYGTNATGGVINIVPKRMTEAGFQTRFGGGIGAYETRKYSLSHGGKTGAFDYFVSAQHRQTDGHRAGSAYEGRHVTAHAGYRLGPSATVEINGNLADIVVRDPGTIANPREDDWYDILRYGGDVAFAYDGPMGETQLKLHGNFGTHRFFDGWRSRDQMLGLMAHRTLAPWRGSRMTVGFDVKRYGGEAADAASDYGSFFVTESAPYLHAQQLLAGKVIVSAGIRLEHHSLYGYEVLPKAGLVSHLSRGTTIRVSAAKGFRSPSIRELHFWLPANEALTPDRLWNTEVGLEQSLGKRAEVEGVIFWTEGSNLIQLTGPPPKWINSGSYSHHGYELMLRWMPSRALTFGGSWSDIRQSEGAFHVPGKKLVAYANVSLGSISVFGHLMRVEDLMGADFSGPSPVPQLCPLEEYTLLDVSLLAHPLQSIEVRLVLKNALDAEYQTMLGYPMPGRHVMLDLAYLWDRR